jgi:hypothetical protein
MPGQLPRHGFPNLNFLVLFPFQPIPHFLHHLADGSPTGIISQLCFSFLDYRPSVFYDEKSANGPLSAERTPFNEGLSPVKVCRLG